VDADEEMAEAAVDFAARLDLSPPVNRKRPLAAVNGNHPAGPSAAALRRRHRPNAFAAAAGSPSHLGSLPLPLVMRIIELAAPAQWQGTHLPPIGRPAIKPITLACSPDTKTQREEEAEAAAEAAVAPGADELLENMLMG
jgi:hypothetical protein